MEETQQEEKKEETQDTQQTDNEAPKQEGSGDYTLQHDRPNCIGCAACEAVAPDVWEMNSDGKSDIKGGKNRDDGWQELPIKEEDFQLNKEAADSCPVNVIHIVKKDTKEKII
jgi:ferredoxin